MSKCIGTSKEEALQNTFLRENIATHPSVKSLFTMLYLEDGSGKVTLDHMKAAEHVRKVLNEMSRNRPFTVKQESLILR